MRNVYFLIQLGTNDANLKALKDLGWEKRYNAPSRNLHYRLSLDGKKAIVQVDLTDAERSWLQGRAFATYLGECINGRADAAVHQFIATNAADWAAPQLL
jgi:hypothetical protein